MRSTGTEGRGTVAAGSVDVLLSRPRAGGSLAPSCRHTHHHHACRPSHTTTTSPPPVRTPYHCHFITTTPIYSHHTHGHIAVACYTPLPYIVISRLCFLAPSTPPPQRYHQTRPLPSLLSHHAHIPTCLPHPTHVIILTTQIYVTYQTEIKTRIPMKYLSFLPLR